jgi:hypothetical protein
MSTGTLSLFVFGMIEAPSRGWTDPVVLGSVALSLFLVLAFVGYELHARFAMLDVRLLRNAGLSMGAVALTVMFLVMLGMMFLLTQYLQLGRGYSALETGLLMAPLPLGFALGSGLSERAALSLGANRVTALGLVSAAAALGSLALIDIGTDLWMIELIMLAFGLGGGAVMAPATAMMMGSVPEANAGIGGALNEAARVVGIALGVSILGSVANSGFSSHMRDATSELALRGDAHENSIGAAMQIAAQTGGPLGESLRAAAQGAFVDAFSVAMIVGAVLALSGAALVVRFMPGRMPAPVSSDETRSAQEVDVEAVA